MNDKLSKSIEEIRSKSISDERKLALKPLIEYIQQKVGLQETIHLNFICTHNSRRSQFSHVWAQLAAHYFKKDIMCYSGGVEVTAFNERAVDSLKRSGFEIKKNEGENPRYEVSFDSNEKPIIAFSKLFDDPENNAAKFAAVMTCSHADENCPFIPGTEKRIALNYEDPKAFDGTAEESAKYDERSLQIASEMFYVMQNIE